MNSKKYFYIGTAALILTLFLVGSKLYMNSKDKELSFLAAENSALFIRDYSPRFGNKDAKVFLIEFLDPECESCRHFYPYIKELLKEFGDKVQLVVRYAAFHGNSKTAIRAIEAARKQGKYWEALSLLFEKQPEWGSHHNPRIELIYDFLAGLGLDMNQLREDMQDSSIDKIISQDTEDLKKLNVKGTPTFFVNGKKPPRFGLSHLREMLKEEVKKAYQ